jgi:hypothetical protein
LIEIYVTNHIFVARKLSVAATSHPAKRVPSSILPSEGVEDPEVVIVDHSEPSKPPQRKLLFGKSETKQTKLVFKKLSIDEYDTQKSKAFEAVRKHAKEVGRQAAQDKDQRDAKRREQNAARSKRLYWKKREGQQAESEEGSISSSLQQQSGKGKKRGGCVRVLVR